MKNSILYLMTAAVLLAGCAKEVDKTQVPEIPAGMHAVTITASVDNPETRTSVEIVNKKGIYSWQENEQIAVVETLTGDKNGILPFQILDQENGTFTGSMTDGASLVFAVTPKGALTDVECTDETDLAFTLSLSGIYNFSDGTNAVMVAGLPTYAEGSENPHFTFQHAAALYRVVYENVPVGTAALHFVASGKPITGDFMFDSLEGVEILQSDANPSGDDSADILLDAPVSSHNTTLTFYVPVPTGTYADVTVSLLDEELDATNPIANTTRSFEAADYSVSKGQIVRIPKITLAPVEITKGKEYILATSSELKWTAFDSALEWKNMSWTPTKVEGSNNAAPGSYSDRGVQFGTKDNGVKTVRFTGTGYDVYCGSSTQGISTVDIEVGAKNDNIVTGSVWVDGVPMEPASEGSDSYTAASNKAGVISFTNSTPLLGNIVIDLTLETEGALYVKGITINADNRIDPELAFDPDEHTAVIGSAFTAPTLTAAVGFNGTVTYAVSENDGVASVDASTGEVTIGSNAGEVTITASFAGDDTYKTASASYMLTVVAPSLVVNTTTPDPALCTEGAETTFTVTSNVPWSASTEADFITVSPSGEQAASGGPVTVTVTFAANSSDEPRSAVVSVKPTDQEAYSELNQEVTVTQNKFEVVGAIDVLNQSWTGITGQNYSLKTALNGSASDAVYTVNAAGSNESIQLRSNNSDSGIVTTSSGGRLKKITVKWNSNTADARILDVYAKNTAYANPTDLYNSNKQGTLVHSFKKSNGDASYTFESNYEYIGIRSQSGALYLDEIDIEWISTNWVLDNIAVTTPPTKTVYEVGEQFDPAGMVVTATYVDAEDATHTKQQVIPVDALTFSPALDAALAVSNTGVTVAYEGKQATQPITVIQWDLDHIAVKEGITLKTSYYVGQNFDPSGLVIVATYKDHFNATNEKLLEVPYDENTFTISPSGELAVENTSVTIGYGGKSTTLAITVSVAPVGPNDYSANYSSNVDLTTNGGSNASNCKVKIGETNYDGIKAGTSSKVGSVKITVPKNTKYLHLHVAGWNGETVVLSVSPDGYSEAISVTSNSGISGNSPFTFNGDPSTAYYYKVITFSSALSTATDLTFTATGGKRFVIWGVMAE